MSGLSTIALADASFNILFGSSDDFVKSMSVQHKGDVTKKLRDDAKKEKDGIRRIVTLNQLAVSKRTVKEAVVIFLNVLPATGIEQVSDEDLAGALHRGLIEYLDNINQEHASMTIPSEATALSVQDDETVTSTDSAAGAPTPAATEPNAKTVAADQKRAAAEAAAQARKAAAEQQKAAAEAAKADAAAKKAAEAAAKKEAAEKAKAEQAAAKAQESAAKAQKQAEAEAKLAVILQGSDGTIKSAEENARAALEALKAAKAAKAEALKVASAELGIPVKTTGSTTDVPKSTALAISEPLTVWGTTFPAGTNLRVKHLHIAGWKANFDEAIKAANAAAGVPVPTKDDVVTKIKELFPTGSTSKKDVDWHWNMLRNGKIDSVTGKRLDV